MSIPKKNMLRLLKNSEFRTWHTFVNAFQALHQHFEEDLLKEKCSYSRFQLLFFLYFGGPQLPIELSKKMFVTRSNMSMFLKRMSRDNLVTDCPQSFSKKRPCYILASKGIKLFERLFPKHIDKIIKKMTCIPNSHLKAIEDDLINLQSRH